MPLARQWIKYLGLAPHPEGGWYRETYRSSETIARASLPARFDGDRAFATAIYYLLESGDFSALHRIRQDEGWHFYDGSPLTLHLIAPDGTYTTHRLGRDLHSGQEPQALAPAGWYFAATVDEAGSFSLVGCTVAPGFDFADFEMPAREELSRLYPQHREVIECLTRVAPVKAVQPAVSAPKPGRSGAD
jgi:predicted cupin superfamily sugar epimerase